MATDKNSETKSGKVIQAKAKPFIIPKPPSFTTIEAERAHKLDRLSAAFRIFAHFGYEEGVAGHLTIRDPEKHDHFWVNPFGIPFALMKTSDLLCVNDQGVVVAGGNPKNQIYNTAAFAIHHQIHKARPDANAACHSHSIYGKAFSALGKNLDITTQDACTFYNNISLYPNFGGVVVDEDEGKRIAEYLGNRKAIILQNHGILTVGETIDSAVQWFHALERACHVQLLADAAAKGTGSETVKIGEEEAEFTSKQIGSEISGWFAAQPYFTMIDHYTKGDYKN